MFIGVFRAARPLRMIYPKEGAAMIEAVMLSLIGIGALLVSIGSMLRIGVARHHDSDPDCWRGRVRTVCAQ